MNPRDIERLMNGPQGQDLVGSNSFNEVWKDPVIDENGSIEEDAKDADGIVILNADGNPKKVKRQVTTFYGRPLEDLLPETREAVLDWYHSSGVQVGRYFVGDLM